MDFGKGVSRRAKTQFELDREGLVFASAYTFAKVMADNPDLARRFAERLLGIQIGALEFFEVEMDIPTALRKSVRMDAILAGSGEVIEIEMQSERDGNLERRLRYYQAMIDSRSLGKGQMYRDLPELYMLAMPVPPPLSLRCRGPVFLPKTFSPHLWAMIGKPSISNMGCGNPSFSCARPPIVLSFHLAFVVLPATKDSRCPIRDLREGKPSARRGGRT